MLDLPRTFEYPSVAHGGRWIVILQAGPRVLLLDTREHAFREVDVSADVDARSGEAFEVGFGDEGRELRVLHLRRFELLRYALPDS